ncbi:MULTISPECIES: oligosaccharide biosynthesis protein Alg14 [unclassified Enterococcus]|jgi:hypothetical protein|uniref:oligosaccharide biosynthesis protein Alg14 n=1 Tax=unclassified Enterococcus TaxID=2608891 RepID=UPI003D2D1DB8
MSANSVLLIPKDKELYFFSSIASFDVISGKELFNESFFKEHPSLDHYELIIFLDYGFDTEMAARIRSHVSGKIILFFWNHFKKEHFQLLEKAQNEPAIDEIYHFDALEANALKLKHNSSFYSSEMKIPHNIPEYDLFFGATNHGRKEKAEALKKEFDALGLRTDYFILPLKGNEQAGYLPYPEYLERTSHSAGILELLREGQHGVTLRTFESVYFQKKLLTANKVISHYHFYDPENFFLLNERPLAELPDFLHRPYRPVEQKYLEFFDAQNWAKRFANYDPNIFKEYEYKEELLNETIEF